MGVLESNAMLSETPCLLNHSGPTFRQYDKKGDILKEMAYDVLTEYIYV